MTRPPLHRRALVALTVVLVALTGLVATAPAAMAQTAPRPPADTSPWRDGVRAVAAALAEAADRVRPAGAAAPSCAEAVPADAQLPTMVVAIFRCRLTEAGIGGDDARRTLAEALVVAACESEWDAGAVVFDGRYVQAPHPNGNRYTAAGVFQLIRRIADRWVDGGYDAVLDPRRNIDAAARLHVHTRAHGFRGWEDWACAAASDGFRTTSVLPGWPGGPAELPAWAWNLADAA